MTPHFPVLLLNSEDSSYPEPKKHASFTNSDFILRQNGAFWHAKHFLKVVTKLKYLQIYLLWTS
jgi:hypothetical protein